MQVTAGSNCRCSLASFVFLYARTLYNFVARGRLTTTTTGTMLRVFFKSTETEHRYGRVM